MPPVRILVAGAGLIGRTHVQRILAEPEAALAGIVDPTPEAEALARKHGVPWGADLAPMLALAKPDAVIVATPNALHVPMGLACIVAGLPMLLEKPVADTVDGAWSLVAAAEKAGVPVLVGHHHRHSPFIAAAKETVASGRLGRLVTVNALTWFLKPADYFDTAWRRAPGGGPILINLIHLIDDLRNLCGDIAEVQAVASNAVRGFPVEDTAAMILRFRNGALGTVSLSDTVASPWSWELTAGEYKAYPQTDQFCILLAGTEGALSVPRLEHWRHEGARGWWSPIQATRITAPEQDPLALQLRHFCSVVRGQAKPLIDAREGTRTLEATLAVKQAAETGRAVRLD
ncbi:MAG: Gfo/Idh/MocA family oxidoreductase [Rhodospirillales bacterium]|nr:Gfo/Idh/MocA family oxidoreductase [Rhodospirillales bacterium]